MHTNARVVVEQVDGPCVSIFVFWHPIKAIFTYDIDGNVEITW